MAKKAAKPLMHPRSGNVVEGGTINLQKRPVFKQPDGKISTEHSSSFRNNKGEEVLIPTIVKGKQVSFQKAKEHYGKTGEHMGKFKTPAAADKYAEKTHLAQEKQYIRKKPLVPKSRPRKR